MALTVGIDFGTTNTAVALFQMAAYKSGGDPLTYFKLLSPPAFPSVCWFRTGCVPIVGSSAKSNLRQYGEEPGHRFVVSPKSILGDPAGIEVLGEVRSSAFVAEAILRHAAAEAEKTFGSRPSSATLTFPINMSAKARTELVRAARRAGLEVRSLLHEPFAAVVGALVDGTLPRELLADEALRRFLVVDWGGGTLDVALVELSGGILRQVASKGLAGRAGDRFDELLARAVLARSGAGALETLRPASRDRLQQACEATKLKLSLVDQADVILTVHCGTDVKHIGEEFSRTDFEELVDADVTAGLALLDGVLAKAGVHEAEVFATLAVGGTCHLPLVQRRLQERFGPRLHVPDDPEALIARGASVAAALNVRPCLSGAIQVELPEPGQFFTLFDSNDDLQGPPPLCSNLQMFVTDPRDGLGKFALWQVGTEHAGRIKRTPLPVLAIPVSTSLPLAYREERVDFALAFDDVLVLHADGLAATRDPSDRRSIAYEDLDFGLDLRGLLTSPTSD